ncbi:uncharacterized protein LOC142531476 isoform X4 [Primulina tabacum]|uniref:uncharacterized protein LOC142531476 isoform X4 n=1 Tax=Primulina tabacum TaxID=48773 RepID=UPI003F590913
MMGCNGCVLRWTDIEAWIQDYDRIQSMAVKLIYAQIGCALIGSLGAFFNAVLLVNLGVSLFALFAIESSSQSLARTRMPSETFGTFVTFSAKLTLTMQIIGFSVSPPTPSVVRRPSGSDDAVGGSIYDPAYYSSLFEDGKDESYLCGGGQCHGISVVESASSA